MKPDMLNYAPKPDSDGKLRNHAHKRPLDRTTLSTPDKPQPRIVTFAEKNNTVQLWRDVREAMNNAAALRLWALADDYLARLRAIEQELGYTPKESEDA